MISDFEEFDHNGYRVSTDLGSAHYDFDREIVTLQGKARGDGEVRQVEVELVPEDSHEFNVSVSASSGEILGSDLDYDAELESVIDLEEDEPL